MSSIILFEDTLEDFLKPCKMPVINDGGSEGSLLVMMYGRLPITGNRGGPGGKHFGFFVPLYVSSIKRAAIIRIGIHILIFIATMLFQKPFK